MQKDIYIVSLFLITSLLSACKQNNQVSNNVLLDGIEVQIWQHPDNAALFLETFSSQKLSKTDQMHCAMLHELANLRLKKACSPDSIMQDVIAYYQEKNMQPMLAKAYYIQGMAYMQNSQYFEAMQSLKEAESRFCHLPDSLPYRCLLPYAQGRISETEYLYNIACTYYQQALEQAILLNDSFRIACCYNDIARTTSLDLDSTSLDYFDRALEMANIIHDTIVYVDVMIQKERRKSHVDSCLIYQYAQYFTDSLKRRHYACIVAEYLQNHSDLKVAQNYLDIYARDTAISSASKNLYLYLTSRQEYLSGNANQAYLQLENLYLQQTDQLLNDGKAKTYTISRMYDVEQEKNKNLKLRVEKQHIWIIMGTAISVLIIILLSIIYFIYTNKQREHAQQQELEISKLLAHEAEVKANEQIHRLNMELEIRREILLDSLKNRIELSKRLAQKSESIEEQAEHPSKPLKKWLAENVFFNGQNADKLRSEFQKIYGNLLDELRQEYEKLSDKDLLFIALSILGLDVNDISYIFGTTDRTTWNRRQQIKNRIGNPKLDFDEWILSLRKKN